MRQAVIDLGTNTCHLMIVDREVNGVWIPVVRHRIFVKLGEEGIKTIGAAAKTRCLDAMHTFKAQLDAAEVDPYHTRAFGTAALRTATNGQELVKQIAKETGIVVEVISGQKEADGIYKGVRSAVPFPDNRVLIMDIGGGSVEFIIASREKVFWQGSFDIGVSILYQHFHKSDPITHEEHRALVDYLDIALKDLKMALQQHPCPTLIGASGAFDAIDLFILDPATKPKLYGYIKRAQFDPLYQMFLKSTLAERQEMPGLALERIEMIVVAQILVQFVLELAQITEIYTSEYSLKEGMLEQM
jgi:exopolyphosphatase / guanosine-5'-triphosphate,3'-diphosphate pyrophosphatase